MAYGECNGLQQDYKVIYVCKYVIKRTLNIFFVWTITITFAVNIYRSRLLENECHNFVIFLFFFLQFMETRFLAAIRTFEKSSVELKLLVFVTSILMWNHGFQLHVVYLHKKSIRNVEYKKKANETVFSAFYTHDDDHFDGTKRKVTITYLYAQRIHLIVTVIPPTFGEEQVKRRGKI